MLQTKHFQTNKTKLEVHQIIGLKKSTSRCIYWEKL